MHDGKMPVPSAVAIKVVEMVSRAALKSGAGASGLPLSQITQLAFRADEVIQMPQILQAIEMYKTALATEGAKTAALFKRLGAQARELETYRSSIRDKDVAAGFSRLAKECEGLHQVVSNLTELVCQLDDYVIYLHENEKKYVLPEFLKRDDPTIYPKEVIDRGHLLRQRIGGLIPRWLQEHLDKRNARKDTPPAVRVVREKGEAP